MIAGIGQEVQVSLLIFCLIFLKQSLWKRREDLLDSTGKVLIENALYFQNLEIKGHFTMAIVQ